MGKNAKASLGCDCGIVVREVNFLSPGPGHAKKCHVIYEQQRRRSACTSLQSDQRLCCSLLR